MRRALPSTLLIVVTLAPTVFAQCTFDWERSDGNPGVVGTGTVFAATTWDPDGPGPQSPLAVFGGTFVAAGDVATTSVAAWDGSRWRAMGDGISFQVRDLTVYNGQLIAAAGNNTFGGTGPDNGVAAFDGTSWRALSPAGFQNSVFRLAVYSGDLIAAGIFSTAGGVSANNIARWNGVSWQPMGAGIPNGVGAMTVFNGELYAANNRIYRWTGATWQQFGPPLNGNIDVLGTYNGQLVAGGSFRVVAGGPANCIARWDGAAWQPFGAGMDDAVFTIATFNGELIAGGIFLHADGIPAQHMARWNGTNWTPIEPGFGAPIRRCDSLVVYNNELYAGGATTAPSGLQAEQVGRWDGIRWRYVGDGIDEIVYDLESYAGELVAAGAFSHAGDINVTGIAARNDQGWHTLGEDGANGIVYSLALLDGDLLAAGEFTVIDGIPAPGVARWDGGAWHAFGNVGVDRLLVHNNELYAAGTFGSSHVAHWDRESASWEPIGSFPPNVGVSALTFFNGDLIAGGIGGIGVNASVWRWDFDNPGTWQPIGQHLGFASVQTLAAFQGELIAGGYMDAGLVRFNGTSWVPLGGGIFLGNEAPDELLAVFDLRVYNDELIVAGTFSYVGAQEYDPAAVTAFHVARWDGTRWHAFSPGVYEATGTNDAAVTLHEDKNELVVGGWFTTAGGFPAGHYARWAPTTPGDVDGDHDVDLTDLAVLLAHFGQPASPAGHDGDLNGDGVIDLNDLAFLLSNFGRVCP